jgi:hypothetical protein
MRACTQTHACFVQVLCVLYNKARLRQVFIISQRSSGNGRSHFVREHTFSGNVRCLFYIYRASGNQAFN